MSMKVVILCGGRGTRLFEETEFRPKPLIEIGGQPILLHIMQGFMHYGLRDFVLCLGYKGHQFKEYFLNYDALRNDFTISIGTSRRIELHAAEAAAFDVTLCETGMDTMTGGRVRRIQPHIDSDTFIVTYGDGLCDVPIDKLIAFHRSHGRIATVTAVRPYSRFGELDIVDGGEVQAFREKPQLDDFVSGGYFVFDRRIFDFLPDDPALVLEGLPMQRLIERRELMAYQHEGFFFAVDTYRDYLQATALWEDGSRPWAPWLGQQAIPRQAHNG